jgi:hypothetical protein
LLFIYQFMTEDAASLPFDLYFSLSFFGRIVKGDGDAGISIYLIHSVPLVLSAVQVFSFLLFCRLCRYFHSSCSVGCAGIFIPLVLSAVQVFSFLSYRRLCRYSHPFCSSCTIYCAGFLIHCVPLVLSAVLIFSSTLFLLYCLLCRYSHPFCSSCTVGCAGILIYSVPLVFSAGIVIHSVPLVQSTVQVSSST